MPITRIKDLRHRMQKIQVEGMIMSKEMVPTSSKPLAKAILKDDTGEIILNLWRAQIDQVKVGDQVKIIDGFVRARAGKLELSTWSNLEVSKKVGKSE